MRQCVRVLLVGGLLSAAGANAFAQAPFEPLATTPDHVVTMTAVLGGKAQSRIVTHRGEWTRVETTQDGRLTTEYFKRNEATIVRIQRGNADEYSSTTISRGPEQYATWDYKPVRTGERQ